MSDMYGERPPIGGGGGNEEARAKRVKEEKSFITRMVGLGLGVTLPLLEGNPAFRRP